MRLFVLALLLMTQAAWAQQARVPVRAGDHPGFGRVVFDWPTPPAYRVEQEGDRVIVRFPPGALALEGLRRMPRNLLAMQAVEGGVALTLAPGARLRHFRNGAKVAFDVLDADTPARAGVGPSRRVGSAQGDAARTAPPPARPAAPEPAAAILRPPAAPTAAPAVQDPPAAVIAPPTGELSAALAGPSPPPAVASPMVVEAPAPPTPVAPPRPAPTTSLQLPFPAEAGAAMLRRGDTWLIAFDAAAEVGMDAPLRPGARLQPIPGGALITLDAAAEWAGAWHLARNAEGRWSLSPGDPPPGTAHIQASAGGDGTLVFPANGARRVLSLQDPVSGLPLLVGTQPPGGGFVAGSRDLVDVRLLDTRLGVGVLARSDSVVLRAGTDRFVLGANGAQRLALGGTPAPSPPDAEGTSRSFDFPAGNAAQLAVRLRAQQAGLAQAPPLARGGLRLAAAETLMALGQPQEAQAMVQLAQQEDPVIAALPQASWLAAAAALAANRMDEAEALLGTPVSTETALWRGLFQARQGNAATAADALAAGRAILLGYPEALLRRLLPPAVEALAIARPDIAERLLADTVMAGLDLARAVLDEGQGRAEQALAGYDRLARSRDRRSRAEAMRRAVELRLARGETDPRAAARALEQTLLAWRDEGAEFSTRSRIAALRAQGGDARGALSLLRETAALFPDREAALAPATQRAFLDALRQESPLAAVALHDSQPELMPQGAEGIAALALLAERLAALDLPDRATALLRDAMRRAPAGPSRAALGARLAALQLAERQDAAAAATLVASAAPDLDEALRTERAALAARAEGRSESFAVLGAAGDEALAEFLADRRDFAGAAAALGRHLDRRLQGQVAPLEPGILRAIVRHAALLALAGDNAGLGRIRTARSALLLGSVAAAPFQLLTTDPLRGLADLPRFHTELELFRAMPSRLESLRVAQAITR